MSVVTRASAAIDRGVVRFMERRMSAPRAQPDDARDKLVELAATYSAGTLGLPSPFFPLPDVPRTTETPAGDGPLGTHAIDLTWRSDYEPFHPAARAIHGAAPENHTAYARLWTSGSGRPVIVLLHGWGGGNPRVTSVTFGAQYWMRHGFDVCAFTLPYHGARAPGPSGALFPGGNPLRTNEAFGQAIFDLRALAIALRARGASAIGVFGMSLGGYTTALWASVDPTLDFAVAMIPAVSFAKLMWQHGDKHPARQRAASAGITEDLLADAFAVHAPTTRPPCLPPARLAVIAGRGDRITPPEHAEQLAAHWDVPVGWFDGGHLAQLGRGEAIRDVRKKLGLLQLSGQRFRD